MLKSRVWKIQKLEIDLKQHKRCYEYYICGLNNKVCSKCAVVVVDIIILKREMRDYIEDGYIESL